MQNNKILKKLQKLLGKERVITDPDELLVYESDAMPLDKRVPEAVVFPESTAEVSSIVRMLHDAKIPFVPRGAGTGLSGGCLTASGGVVISLTRMTKIHEIDIENRCAVVEPGVINQWITDRVNPYGLCFAPDPSSGHACTVGGNVAENAGGPHTIKYGATANHILGLEIVLPDGEIVTTGGKAVDSPSYDLTGVICGSEGTFGILTRIIVKLTRLPESYATFCAVFETIHDATSSITGLLHAGVEPAALEIIDGEFIQALKSAFHLKFPEDAGAILFIELDGTNARITSQKKKIAEICREFNVRQIDDASSAEERARLWKARKLAFGAVGRLSPNYYTQDGTVPRTKLPEILARIYAAGRKHGIRIANAFHAGDGNLHPCLMYDERIPGDLEKVKSACEDILRSCVELGGTLSGEHGIGLEKNEYMSWIFSEDDLACMKDLKTVFNPGGFLNPGKIFPTSRE